MKHFVLLYFVVGLFQRKTAGIFVDPDSYRSVVREVFVDPDSYRSVQELITEYGYPLEEYTVQTSDGYLLSLQRIPHGKNCSTKGEDKEVVLLVHGELGDAKTWFLNPPGQSLGYILPDEGYDVWLINHRGCDYSKKHVKYSTRDSRFWDFSFDEQGLIDLPDTIDFILNATGKESLLLVGFSRGNTVAFVLLSEKPEYNAKVKLVVALAPIAFIGNFKIAVVPLIPVAEELAVGINLVTHGEFLPHNKVTKIITAKYCEVDDLEICQNVIFAIGGEDRKELNQTRLPIYAAQYPSSTSTKGLVHYAQMYRSKKFRKYDYKPLNILHYGQIEPPDYQLSRITAPVALFASENDKIGDPEDVDILRGEVKSIVYDLVVDEPYNHFDFIFAKNSPKKIYEPLLQLLTNYSKY